MALRSRSRTATVSSGPGRGPASDGRMRPRPLPLRSRARHRHASAEEARRRAEALFPERAGDRRELGMGPPPLLPVEEDDERGSLSATPVREAVEGPDVSPAGEAWRARTGLALRERMPLWLQARCGLERRSVFALGALLVVAAVFAVQHFWIGRTQSVRAPEVVRAAAPFGERKGSGQPERDASAGAPNAAGAAGTAGTAGAEIVVDVSGKVRDPGIHRLPAGSRVVDALHAAGGVRPGTSTDGLNRARFLVDGEQVIVGGPAAPVPGSGGAAAGAPAAGAAPAAPVALNTATVDQLDTLPGVGPVLAQHIIDYRTQHGGFRSVNELREVNGIGDRRFADLRNLVRP
ncbi:MULTISPECIES: ComEA family DNA-binding protein [unclassified Streptomyces]|uniref:ComEA family DNA-binding protein n=2 Tax=Streptomyces TaxID=1883 RepID=UPI002257A287|nr:MULTISPECIES: ComEA family DNA-binding protein [unclassified Streptomyces]MCX5057177.1 ComEA family DNA-binding protein [Streptomyces sp. NBC_00452]MCX5288252.1 ComEA family DNA-binding protein [Streptomyces sp. NBC_00183]